MDRRRCGAGWRQKLVVVVRLFVLTAALLAVGFPAFAAASVTIKTLLEEGEKYHQQPVSVIGEAADLRTVVGPRNLPFYTFRLRNADGSVMVQGKPELSNGDQVYVYGIFVKSRKAGRTTITNRIEATIVEQLHDRREPLVG